MADRPEQESSSSQKSSPSIQLPEIGPVHPRPEPTHPPIQPAAPPVDPPKALSYSELTVRISANQQGQLKGQVIASPLGESTVFDLSPPVEDADLDDLIRTLEFRGVPDQLRADQSTEEAVETSEKSDGTFRNEPSEEEVAALDQLCKSNGAKLTASLFPGKALRFLQFGKKVVDHEIRHNGSHGMRLRLVFTVAPGAPGSAKLNQLIATPWDLLTDPQDSDHFLCRSSSYAYLPLVYSFGVRAPTSDNRAEIKPPLKVLLVLQSAINSTNLDLGAIVHQIRTAISGTETVTVDVITAPTLSNLGRKINREDYHVVQFLGHGGVYSQSQEGFLFFEHADGSENYFRASDIANTLGQSATIQLVVLGACWSAKADWAQGRSPFLTVAGALYQNGIPAVVAMRYTISTDAISRFSAELFAAIAAGDPIDTAVTEARAALPSDTFEWATPVLFLDAKDGRIFKLRRLSRPAGSPLSLGITSFEGWGEKLTRHSDRVLSLVQNFEKQEGTENRYVRDLRLWNQKMFPQLRRFLVEAVHEDRPIVLEMQAHQSLAFAAGYILEAKSGLDIGIRQRGMSGTSLWSVRDGTEGEPSAVPPETLWQPFSGTDEHLRDQESNHLAVAIGITRPVLGDVERYLASRPLAKSGDPLTVHRILSATVDPGPGQTTVRGGAHAAAMASTLLTAIAERPPAERGKGSTIHLFASVPNAFLFFLGQMARGLGQIQLYEYEFDQAVKRKIYRPSLLLPQEVARDS